MVIRKTSKGYEALIERVNKKNNSTVDIGVIDAGKHDESELSVATIAITHEYGLGVPVRSVYRASLAEKKLNWLNYKKNF
ncbi:MAG: hypothetical protein OMM_06624 [Candidatus Magnetoglobus multicellularis str. Araruama]|uniref:Uncharacterized protein n=1 Tax=Candidatus Magnetoglobus multicellularis str. Araruama TaxID=890399 RepID=A0A1V1PGJ5_9BACT|nr:MAG: hypothetical protein OMM_06624 [Candidatus Magnetoglobus multicellularis str. Araruama]